MSLKVRIALVFLWSMSSINTFGQVSKVWETDTVFRAPESVVFDHLRNCLYVANYNDEGGFKRKQKTLHNEFVSKLDLGGNIQNLKWIDSLHNPTGMTVFKDKLYIVEREGLTIVNIENQSIDCKVPIEGAVFLNDVVVDKDGTAYISDSSIPCIYRIKNNKSEIWYSHSLITNPNGLLIENGHLFVGNRGNANLLSVSLLDKKISVIAEGLSGNIDGLKKLNDRFLCSWNIQLYFLNQGKKKLLHEFERKIDFIADFEFIPERNLIIAPNLISNKVMAMKLDE